MAVNKVILLGRLGKDPELKVLQDGGEICNFSVATGESWKDKAGVKQERTEWHSVSAFGKLAKVCADYLAKGREVYIEGKIHTRKWQDKDGVTRYSTGVVAQAVQFIGSKPSQQTPGDAGQDQVNEGPHGTDDIPF